MTSFISQLEIINVVKSDPNIFLQIASFVADAAVVNPNCIKTFLANDLSTFAIQFLVMALKVYLQILLIVLVYVTEFLIIFH